MPDYISRHSGKKIDEGLDKILGGELDEKLRRAEDAAKTAGSNSESSRDSAVQSKSWAVGGTGTRPDEDINNAKYWSKQAEHAAGGGVTSFNDRSGIVFPEKGDYKPEQVGFDFSETRPSNPEEKTFWVNPKGDTTPGTLVTKFNGRAGVVTPQASDYSSFFAPAGFGLGTNSVPEIQNLDEVRKTGWCWGVLYINGKSQGVSLTETIFYNNALAVQISHLHSISTYYGENRVLKREGRRPDVDWVWGDWEWVNPPMLPGVEYRTVEKYQNRPVFTQFFDAGGFDVPGKAKEFFLDREHKADNLVSATAVYNGYKLPIAMYGGTTGLNDASGKIFFDIAVESAYGLYVFKATPTGGRDLSGIPETVKVLAKYTKVGDK